MKASEIIQDYYDNLWNGEDDTFSALPDDQRDLVYKYIQDLWMYAIKAEEVTS